MGSTAETEQEGEGEPEGEGEGEGEGEAEAEGEAEGEHVAHSCMPRLDKRGGAVGARAGTTSSPRPPASEMSDEYLHERLDGYQLAVSISRWAARQVFPQHRKHLRDQLSRAADSVVLNIAEAAGKGPGDARRHHYRMPPVRRTGLCGRGGGDHRHQRLRRC